MTVHSPTMPVGVAATGLPAARMPKGVANADALDLNGCSTPRQVASGRYIAPPSLLADLIEREQLRSRIEAAVARLIDALDAIDAPGENLEDGDDAEVVNEDGGDINDERHDDRPIKPTGVYGNAGVSAMRDRRAFLSGLASLPLIGGDARRTLTPADGESMIPGLTYEALRAAGAGVLEIGEGDSFKIIPARGANPYAGLTEGEAALARRMQIDVSGPLFGAEVDGVVMGD